MYIGQTTINLEERWKTHCSLTSHCLILKNAIKKYGKDNFEINVFQNCDTQDQANQIEIYWINRLRIELGNKNIYNIKDGGSNGSHAKETCNKISKSLIGNKRAVGSKPNSGAFTIGKPAPNKGRKRMIDENGKTRYIKVLYGIS